MASPRRWRLILNGKSAEDAELREAVLAQREAGRQVDVRVTWEHGDAVRYVAEAASDAIHCVIAGGGDGTVGEVAGALADLRAQGHRVPSLAMMPRGTANDFARAAGVPDDIDGAFALAAEGHASPIDILRVTADGQSRWCLNLASGGFGTDATVEANDVLKRLLGGLSYVVQGIARLHAMEAIPIELRGPDFHWTGSMIVLGLGNARFAGGGQMLCPEALIDDGLLDVTVIPELEEGVVMTMVDVMRDGQRATLERVAAQARLPWVELRSTEAIRLNLDGEPLTARQLRIECMPRALEMHLPRDCPLLSRVARSARHAPEHRALGAEPL